MTLTFGQSQPENSVDPLTAMLSEIAAGDCLLFGNFHVLYFLAVDNGAYTRPIKPFTFLFSTRVVTRFLASLLNRSAG